MPWIWPGFRTGPRKPGRACFASFWLRRKLRFMDAELLSRITIEPGKRSGKPCIRGLRITVSDVLEYLASGMTEAEILADFPELTSDDVRACLAFAAERERRLLGSVA
jgi:uncharacterized protein (DUF433 family)